MYTVTLPGREEVIRIEDVLNGNWTALRPYRPSEIIVVYKECKRAWAPLARANRLHNLLQGKKTNTAKDKDQLGGRIRDVVAKAFIIGSCVLGQMEYVVDACEANRGNPEYGAIYAQLEKRGHRVKGCYNRIKALENYGEIKKKQKVMLKTSGLHKNEILLADVEKILPKLPDECAAAVLSDPPYGIGFSFNRKKEQASSPGEYKKWFLPIYRQMYRILRPGGFVFFFQATQYMRYYWEWYEESVGLKPDTLRVFISARITEANLKAGHISTNYDAAVFFYKPGGPELKPKKKALVSDFFQSSELPSKEIRRQIDCSKPLDLTRYIVKGFTIEDGLCVVPFSGTGPFEVACQQLGRPFMGIEREEKFVRIAKDQLAKLH